MKTRCWQWLFAAMFVLCASSLRAADNEEAKPAAPPDDAASAKAAPPTNSPSVAPAPANVTPEPVIPPKLSLPPVLDQVVRLSKSGTDESVIRAYVEKAASPYQITGNDIVQLQDLGVSKNVILALIEHSKTATPSVVEAPVAAPAPEPTPPPTNATPQSTTEAAGDYYDALAPYGSWVDVPGYGLCWQPTVVVVNPGWRPYCDNGYWLWSDCGWYWNSYYSWGWAPFHYGRWFCHGNRGWYWCPDRVWGPAWVSWRNSGRYCGWAPLPPGACFTAGVGWTHRGVRVGVDFGFGIASAHFNFVSHDRFTDRHVGRHTLRGHDANTAYANTRVINNYTVGGNNRVFNHGIGREQVAAARGTPIQTASTTELTRRGNALATRTFTTSGRGQSVANGASGFQASRTTTASMGTRSTWQNSPAAVTPRTAQNYAAINRAPAVQQQQPFRNDYAAAAPRANVAPRVNPTPQYRAAPRVNTAPQFQQRSFGNVGRSAVAPRSFSPPAASRQFAPQSFSRPSFQGRGSSFGGGVSRGGGMSVGRSFAARR